MNENFTYKMKLTDEQAAILHGSKGETMAKVMKTLVLYGSHLMQKKWFLLQARKVISLQASVLRL